MKTAHLQRERRRLNGILASSESHPFEREQAERDLVRLAEVEDPTCPHCARRSSTHRDQKCPVVAKFQKKNGKDVFPTAGQASEVRQRMAEIDAENARAARAAGMKASQTKLF